MRGILSLLPLLTVAFIGCGTSDKPSKPKPSPTEARAAAERLSTTMQALAEHMPAADTLKPTTCTVKPKAMGTVLGPTLLALAGKPTTELDPWVRSLLEVGGGSLANLRPKMEPSQEPELYVEAAKQLSTLTHVMVWWVVESAAPQVNGTDVFAPGFVNGWLIVFDLATHTPACSWPIVIGSSEKVQYTVSKNPDAIQSEVSQRNATGVDMLGQINGATHRAKQSMGL